MTENVDPQMMALVAVIDKIRTTALIDRNSTQAARTTGWLTLNDIYCLNLFFNRQDVQAIIGPMRKDVEEAKRAEKIRELKAQLSELEGA